MGLMVEAASGNRAPSQRDPPLCYCIVRHEDEHFKDIGYNYYVFRATSAYETVMQRVVQDDYGTKFRRGDRILKGNYFVLATDVHGKNYSQDQGLYIPLMQGVPISMWNRLCILTLGWPSIAVALPLRRLQSTRLKLGYTRRQ